MLSEEVSGALGAPGGRWRRRRPWGHRPQRVGPGPEGLEAEGCLVGGGGGRRPQESSPRSKVPATPAHGGRRDGGQPGCVAGRLRLRAYLGALGPRLAPGAPPPRALLPGPCRGQHWCSSPQGRRSSAWLKPWSSLHSWPSFGYKGSGQGPEPKAFKVSGGLGARAPGAESQARRTQRARAESRSIASAPTGAHVAGTPSS